MKRASEVQHFPYGYPGKVCYIETYGGEFDQISGRDALRVAVRRARESGHSTIYAVWPGQYRSDLFWVDDLDALAATIKA